ncbi:MAG: DUF4407 domain-containing protein [Alloprevotella sp.]|nr:DUF4407 domain-containing protein [Alloprevotella sp.]
MESNNISNNKEEKIEWGGWLNEFLWICAGANREVLRQCPTDYSKYAGIGGTILFTALMAMLSGGYALFTVFKSQMLAVLFGVFWGLLIFNLDRFIVNTMYSDGKVTISRREFYSGLPRIIMAIFLGVIISTPLELKIYEDGINNEIEHMKEEELSKRTERLDNEINKEEQRREDLENRDAVSAGVGGFSAINSELGQRLGQLQGEQRSLSDRIRNKQQELKRYSPVNSPKQYQVCSQEIRKLQNQRAKVTRELHEVEYSLSQNNTEYANALREADSKKQREIATINERIEQLKKSVDDKNDINIKKLEDELTGFQGRMVAFNRMKDNEPSTRIAALFIALLFIVIETAPTFFKMMIASGPYDDYLRAEMHKVRVLSDKRISDLNDEVNTEVQISTQKNKERLAAEALANKEVMEKIAKAQAELLQTAIDKWREEELAKINENPSAYIQSNSET